MKEGIWKEEGTLFVNVVAVKRIADGHIFAPYDCYIRHGEEGKFESISGGEQSSPE